MRSINSWMETNRGLMLLIEMILLAWIAWRV